MMDDMRDIRPGAMPEAHGPHGEDHPRPPHGPHGEDHPRPPHGPHGEDHPRPPHGPHGEDHPRPPHGPHGAPPPPPHIDWEMYPCLNTDGKLLAMIRALGHASRGLFDGRGGQDRALRTLPDDGAMTQRELTERLGIQPGSASELVGKLERAGLVTRCPSETDRRTADIRLTEQGLARRQERAGREQNETAELFKALDEQEKQTLLALMEKLHASWSAPARRSRPHPEAGPADGPAAEKED